MKSIFLLACISICSLLSVAQDPCASVTVTGGNGQISISGLSGTPIAGVQVFNTSWASVFNQTYTNPSGSVTVSPLPAGQYFVNVRFYNSNWAPTCEKGTYATVSNTPAPPADTCGATFQKTFGGAAGNEEAYNIAKSSDGGFIAVGHTAASGTTNHDGLVMKFNSSGNLLWSKTIGSAQEDYLSQIAITPDGGCLATGATNSNGVGTYTGDAWLVRIDGSGNVLWQKRYYVSGNAGNIYAVIPTSDGGFAFTGTFPFTPGAADWMVVKIDASGNVQWQRRMGANSSDNGLGLVEVDQGGAGLIVTGNIYTTGTTLYDAVTTKLDLSGNVVWTKRYDFDARANWTGTLFKVADGIIYNVKNADGFTEENAKPVILKTDFNGNVMWIKEYAIPNCREGRSIPLPDGGFMMAQSELPHDAASDLYLMRIDASGNITWTKRYPRAGAQWLWGMVSDGNYVVGAGLATNGSYNDVLLAKSDLNGKMGSCQATAVTGTMRDVVHTTANYTWVTNAALNLVTANTTYAAANFNYVENVLCADSCPTVTIGNVTVSENAGNAVLQVCVASPAASTLVYAYTTANGTATAGSDYTGGSGTVTIAAGQTCGTITIPILNDATVESAETFTVSVGGVTATITINDDDQAQGNCNAVTMTPGNNLITITGVTAPIATVQVFNSSWATVFNQTYTNSPGTVNVSIGAGTYLVKVSFYNSNWTYICDKSANVTVENQCPAGTICVVNTCPSATVNLNAAYSIPNLPAGTTVTWHTGTPATDANKMTDAQAQNVSVSGTYYAAINIAGANCYSATIPVNVTIVACSSAPVSRTNNIVQLKSEELPATRNIMVFPNPFISTLRVIIDAEKQEQAELTLMDVQGRRVRQVPVQLTPGSNAILLEGLDKLPSGNYFLKINSANGTKTLKVMRQE